MADWGTSAQGGTPGFGEASFDNGGPSGGDDFRGGGFGGGDDAGGNDRTCNHCGQPGHIKRDCPDAPPRDDKCRHCGQEGHMKRDCPDIPEDQRGPGACFVCGEVGHNKADCPNKPAEMCRNCGEEGHNVRECKNARKLVNDDIPTFDPESAWAMIEKAAKARDLDDLREAVRIYVKAVPDTTYPQLEKAFREHDLKAYIIAYERDLSETFTMMNLQGELGKKYQIGLFFSPKAPRTTMKQGWPATPEENMDRLADAGIPVDTHIPKCNNCEQVGHSSKYCKEEKVERDRVEVRCYNCDEVGHRPRDCPKPREDRFACKNCGQRGHNAKECTEPRSAANVECKNCGQMGHFGKDCPDRKPMLCNNCGEEGHKRSDCVNPTNPAMIKCRNCDEMGHTGRDCPKPRDYSRVTCQNCGENGHTKVRCKAPPKDEGDGGFGDGGFGGANNSFGAGDDGFGGNDTGFGSNSNGFDSAPEPVEVSGNAGTFNDW